MLLSSLVCTFRLSHLETKVIEGVGKTPDIICDLHSQVESFKKKLEVRRVGWSPTRPDTLTLSGSNRFLVFCAAERCTPQLDGSVSGGRRPAPRQVLTQTWSTSAEHGGGAPAGPHQVPQYEVTSLAVFLIFFCPDLGSKAIAFFAVVPCR